MEELKRTFEKVARDILGERADKFEIEKSIHEFFKAKGVDESMFDVDVKRKYIYIRVTSSYVRNEMFMRQVELMKFLEKRCPVALGYSIKFTGRR